MTRRILVIDDDEAVLRTCQSILQDEGFDVVVASTPAMGLRLLRAKAFDLVFIDSKLPQMSGMQVLTEALKFDPDLVAIIFTAFATLESAVEAIKQGAFNYIAKPFTASQLLGLVANALQHGDLRRENALLRRQLETASPLHDIVGASEALKPTLAAIAKAAPSDANVLILGESGTGKELAARAVHANSNRRNGAFVAVDCAALPANLLESELLGFEKGAFTDARQAKRGLLELANGGTILFDEIGEMSMELQAKMLRTLEERSFRRLGSERLISVDVRIISSTNRDLTAEVQRGRFRQDLLYRLNVVTITLPPLRQRKGDIPLLAQHFLVQFCRPNGRVVQLSAEAMQALQQHTWPGNIRELRNVIERAIVFCEGNTIRATDLPDHIRGNAGDDTEVRLLASGYKAVRSEWLEGKGREYVTDLLHRHHGNISSAAREAHISRTGLYDLLRRYSLDPHDFQN